MRSKTDAHGQLKRGPGRPREFDFDEALRKAMEIFWTRGYHATSLNDLSEGMGLTKGSVYKAFKDKKAIFLAAFDLYVENGVVGNFEQGLAAGRPPSVLVRELLQRYARISSTVQGLKGCLVTATALEMVPRDPEVAEHVGYALGRIHGFLLKALTLGKQEGSFAADLDEEGAALFLLCVIQGMRVVGKTAPSEQELNGVVEMALRAITSS